MPIILDLTYPPGTGLDLTAIWLNPQRDPADARGFAAVGGPLSLNTTARVDVRQLANRRRLIRQGSVTSTTVDVAESLQVTLVHLDRVQVAWLKSMTGVLMCVRDHVGTKFYGVYKEAPREVQPEYRDRIALTLQLDQVTHSEAIL